MTAYWISPTGSIIDVLKNHIDTVISNPSIFGTTLEDITAVYEQEDEVLRSEGKAREIIIKSLIKDKWVRIRLYNYKSPLWTVNICNLNPLSRTNICRWANMMIKTSTSRYIAYDEVYIDLPKGGVTYTMQYVANIKK